MHVEVKVAQNFVLNFLYNKLPRRRVNLFGEELESALRDKFADHWYPDKPFKGSAFRCLKITDPADPVLNRAARESGNPVPDIVENLPTDLAIWIDPGEVSYRMGEKARLRSSIQVHKYFSKDEKFAGKVHFTLRKKFLETFDLLGWYLHDHPKYNSNLELQCMFIFPLQCDAMHYLKPWSQAITYIY